MATGYTRQSSANIQAGLPIQSADLNNEFNQAQSAFDITTGHDHSGSSAGTGAKIILSTAVTGVLALANGGSNANLTASNGGIFYSTATAGAILAGTATASQLLISGSSTTPAWSNLASLLTSSTGITLSGTTTVNIAFTSTTGSGAVVLATSPTLTGTLTAATITASGIISTTAQANIFGQAAGSKTSPTNANTNLLLYVNSSSNYAGIGAHTAGDMYFVTGTSAPATRMVIDPSGNLQLNHYTTGALSSDGSGNIASGTLAVTNGGTGTTTSTGTGNVVLSLGPTLDNLGTATGPLLVRGVMSGDSSTGARIQLTTTAGGATNPSKFIRVNTAGQFEIINNAFSSTLFSLTDAGVLSLFAPLPVASGGTGATTLTQTNLSDYTAPTAWTPTDGSGAGLALSVTDAKYVKIGKVVILSAFITYPVTGNGNAAKINGLPVASASGTNGTGGGAVSATAGTSSMIFLTIAAGGTQISGMQGSSAGAFINSDLSGKSFSFTITYISA